VPIRDLLWACPCCRHYGGIRAQNRREACANCGARFAPAPGARISVTAVNQPPEVKTAVQWEAVLPPIDAIPQSGLLGPQQVTLRFANEPRPVRYRGNLIGWAERFGKPIQARAHLDAAALTIEEAGKQRWLWPLERITAVQPSSSTLQINSTGHRLVSIRFAEDSVRRWEAVLQALIRVRHSVLGHGKITGFFPRIRME
jgi:hypothetical protein